MSESKKPYQAKMGAKVWWNGKLIAPENAMVHVTAHSLHYGLAVFEGIRAYDLEDGGVGIFRCSEHMQRFVQSAHIGGMPMPFSAEQLVEGCKEAVRHSGFKACYLRPLGFLDAGPLGVAFKKEHPVTVAIMTLDWGKYLGADAAQQGAKIKISSFTRHHPNVAMTKGKISGHYVNSVLARNEANSLGYDEAILLDPEGYVSEGSGENIFAVRRGRVFSPGVEGVLEGVTRDSVIQICKDLGLEVSERRISRDELYIADEVFFTGTAAEVTPIASIDNRMIGRGKPGEITQEISKRFFDIVHGRNQKYRHWIDRV
jgi:branched-chain amino acid aminotransferase